MRHRLLAFVGYPAHLLNGLFGPPLARLGLARVPAALLMGVGLGAMAANGIAGTAAAYAARPEPVATTVSEIEAGSIDSGLWVVFDAVLVDGPHTTGVEVFQGPVSTTVQRTWYLVADPTAPDRAVVVRSRESIPGFTVGTERRIDGSLTEDAFSMGRLLREWQLPDRHPDVSFGETELVAFEFATPWQEPSFLASIVIGALAALLLAGAFVRQPVLRVMGGDRAVSVAAGRMPISAVADGTVPTPRGDVVLHGAPIRMEWMNVEEVARLRWRYWGAALGDMRNAVESAVREHGSDEGRLVLHGATNSLIWSVERPSELEIVRGQGYLGFRSRPALGVRGEGASVILSFDTAAERDHAARELQTDGPTG